MSLLSGTLPKMCITILGMQHWPYQFFLNIFLGKALPFLFANSIIYPPGFLEWVVAALYLRSCLKSISTVNMCCFLGCNPAFPGRQVRWIFALEAV